MSKKRENLELQNKAMDVLVPVALLVLFLFAILDDAQAEQYSGAFMGQSTADINCNRTVSCEKTGFSYGLLHGYQFNQNWGAEISYTAHGNFFAATDTVYLSGSADTISISAIGFLPVSDQYELFARVGYGYHQKDLHADVVGRFGVRVEPEENGFDYGAGVSLNLAPGLSMRGSYDNYIDVDSLNLAVIIGW